MHLNRTRPAMLIVLGSTVALAVLLAGVADRRRSHRLMMADDHGALQVEAQSRAEGRLRTADILDGKVEDPIRPFLGRGDANLMRAQAATDADRAPYHAGLRAEYLRSAGRPWEPERDR